MRQITTYSFLLIKYFFILILMQLSTGCESCNSEYIAKQIAHSGSVTRVEGNLKNSWEESKNGAIFIEGDAIKTLKSSTAVLNLTKNSGLKLQELTMLRFLKYTGNKTGVHLDLQMGNAQVISDAENIDIQTSSGFIELGVGSIINLSKRGDELTIKVSVGHAVFINDKLKKRLKKGDSITFSIGSAQLLKYSNENIKKRVIKQNLDTDSSEKDTMKSESPVSNHENNILPHIKNSPQTDSFPQPQIADFRVSAGESSVVHSMDGKGIIQIGFAEFCPNGGRVDIPVKKLKFFGKEYVNLLFTKGKTFYKLQCINEVGELINNKIKKGTIVLQKDTLNGQLVKTSPLSRIDADGRKYTISYQGALPAVLIRWQNMPENDSYQLHIIDKNKKDNIFETSVPSFKIPGKSIGEGTFKIKYMQPSTGKRSRTTTLIIKFNNAAPTAILKTPIDKSFDKGSKVSVSGIAKPGWNVKVGGINLEMDEQQRFAGTADTSANYSGLAVKFSNPKRGVHYYLRKAK